MPLIIGAWWHIVQLIRDRFSEFQIIQRFWVINDRNGLASYQWQIIEDKKLLVKTDYIAERRRSIWSMTKKYFFN